MNKDIFHMHRLESKSSCPVMVTRIPKLIMKEIDIWVKESKKTMNHPLAELKAHENVGYLGIGSGKKQNSYQSTIPPRLVEESYWLAWVLRLTAKHWGGGLTHRNFKLRVNPGHFDTYDIWTNFAYKGDGNPCHNHVGFLSGVIYYKNHNHPTIFDEHGCAYSGEDGTMVMFPASTWHHVEEQTANKERITLAFNIQTLKETPQVFNQTETISASSSAEADVLVNNMT
tara:strand:- start:98 stop:781 length:684 start_codon:yes stop_codon:yes gene_type:complete